MQGLIRKRPRDDAIVYSIAPQNNASVNRVPELSTDVVPIASNLPIPGPADYHLQSGIGASKASKPFRAPAHLVATKALVMTPMRCAESLVAASSVEIHAPGDLTLEPALKEQADTTGRLHVSALTTTSFRAPAVTAIPLPTHAASSSLGGRKLLFSASRDQSPWESDERLEFSGGQSVDEGFRALDPFCTPSRTFSASVVESDEPAEGVAACAAFRINKAPTQRARPKLSKRSGQSSQH